MSIDDTTAIGWSELTKLASIETGATADGAAGDAYAVSHEADTTAHAAAHITNTPAGNIAATTVQGAIDELDAEKAAASHNHSGSSITSGTVAATYLPSFGAAAAGIVPASGGGSTNFLRADAMWAAPTGGGGDVTYDTIAALRAGGVGSAGEVVDVKGYYAIGDGGGGLFDWVASSSAADNGGTIINPTGNAGNGRWIRRKTGPVNIRAFGAKADNSEFDSAPAIQAGIDSGEVLYFPTGTYWIRSPIKHYRTQVLNMFGDGPDRSVIAQYGSFSGEPMFARNLFYLKPDLTWHNPNNNTSSTGSPIYLRDLKFQSVTYATDPNGQAFQLANAIGSYIENCHFNAPLRGLTCIQECFDTSIINCKALGQYHGDNWPNEEHSKTAWGLHMGGHCYVVGFTAIGCGTGIYLSGTTCNIHGVRIETCRNGVVVGDMGYSLGTQGVASELSRSIIEGLSLEANGVGMLILSGKRVRFESIDCQGSAADPGSGRPEGMAGFIIRVIDPETCTFTNCLAVGHFAEGDIINQSLMPVQMGIGGNSVGGKLAGAWNPLAGEAGVHPRYSFLKTPIYPSASNSAFRTITAFHDLAVAGLTGVNMLNTGTAGASLNGAVFAQNLGGVVTPANGASTAAVAFNQGVGPAHAAFASDAISDDGSSTLPAGTYYYACTMITPHGETGVNYSTTPGPVNTPRTVTTGQKITFGFYGTGITQFKRRLYRTNKTDTTKWFDGYWEFAGHSFVDDGVAFHRLGGRPPTFIQGQMGQEEFDTNYQIVATASWGTTVWVTNKATTGFTLNFGTAAPDGNQTVSWLLFRP